MQTVKTQMKCHRTRHFARVCTVSYKENDLQRKILYIACIWNKILAPKTLQQKSWLTVCILFLCSCNNNNYNNNNDNNAPSRYIRVKIFGCLFKNSKWVWSGNTTITNCRQPRGIARKSRSTITRHQEDKLSKAISSLFPIKMIAILEWI